MIELDNRQLEERGQVDFDVNKVTLHHSKRGEVDDVLDRYHYLGRSNKGAIYYILFKHSDLVVGAAMVSNPVRRAALSSTCEISRFVLTTDCGNLASKCLSLMINMIRADGKYRRVQAFCENDTHLGTIYKASNFRISGGSYKTYNYDGIHKKTIYERAKMFGLDEHQYAEMFGLNRIVENSKTKFIYRLDTVVL